MGLAIRAAAPMLGAVLSGRPHRAETHPLNLTQLVLAEGRETGRVRPDMALGPDLPTFRRSR